MQIYKKIIILLNLCSFDIISPTDIVDSGRYNVTIDIENITTKTLAVYDSLSLKHSKFYEPKLYMDEKLPYIIIEPNSAKSFRVQKSYSELWIVEIENPKARMVNGWYNYYIAKLENLINGENYIVFDNPYEKEQYHKLTIALKSQYDNFLKEEKARCFQKYQQGEIDFWDYPEAINVNFEEYSKNN